MKAAKRRATRIRVELTLLNARNLQWLERMTGTDARTLLNEFILNDQLTSAKDPRSGALRDMIESTVYRTPAEARSAASRILRFERSSLNGTAVFVSHFSPRRRRCKSGMADTVTVGVA